MQMAAFRKLDIEKHVDIQMLKLLKVNCIPSEEWLNAISVLKVYLNIWYDNLSHLISIRLTRMMFSWVLRLVFVTMTTNGPWGHNFWLPPPHGFLLFSKKLHYLVVMFR